MAKKLDDIYELAPLQQGILFHCLYAPDSAVYNVQLAVELNGTLDFEKFSSAWQQLVLRHASLRTTFAWEDLEHPYQLLHSDVELAIDELDWRDLSADQQSHDLDVLQKQVQSSVMDLARAPLMRLHLVRLDDNRYRFLWTFHHIIFEGWSAAIILRDLRALYNAACHDEAADLSAVRPFHDYINWVQEQDQSRARDYWRHKFHGEIDRFHLPIDQAFGDVPAQVVDCANFQIDFDPALSAALAAMARKAKVTLNTLFQGCWSMLLSHYSGQEEVVFGVVVSGRPPELLGSDEMVGMFVNTLPARISAPADRQLIPWLQELQQLQAESRLYEYCSVSQVQTWIGRSSAIPLYDTNMVYENWLGELPEGSWLDGVSIGSCSVSSGSDSPLTLIVKPGASFSATLRYDTQRFTLESIRRLASHLKTLLDSIAANPHRELSQLPMLDAAERGLLEQWRQAPSDYPRDQTVQSLFEEQVRSSPESIAAEYEGESLSYAELNARANQVGHYLKACGVGPEVVVGICIERSLEMLVALLGILKAGGAYLPLDPEYPQSRLDFMLADSAAPVLLTLSSFTPQFDAFTGRTICLDRDWAEISQESTDNPDSGATAESLIYVIYTSGSTGVPKGTLIEQRSAVRLVRNTNFVELGADEVFLQFAPISFDASTFELWGSLLNGARLVIFPAGRSALEELGEVIEARGVTTLWLTSALFSQMVEHHLASLKGVRQLLAGGEALSLPHVRKMIDNLGENRLINGYGPTENTTFTCCHVMTRDSELGQSVPIGRPISNTTVYILDKRMNPVPVGVAGELYIGGDGLARGYLNQPELTAEKFVADPFNEDQGARLYRTGDQVRYRADGSIEFLGRIDQQIKLRGYRIELGEIETALAQQEAVSEAVAIVRADEAGDKRIIAYVVPTPAWRAQHADTSDESAADELIPELRQQLREQLPSYMVPSLFVVLDELPLNANGKVDRKALPDPEASRAGLEVGYVAPRNELESRLAQIWAEVLQLEQVGIHDNFFDLGGHSLMATQVVSRVREQLGVELPLSKVFSFPTAAELAPIIASLGDKPSRPDVEAIRAIDRDGDLPLSFAQERLWFLDQMEPGNPAYIIPLALRLQGELRVDALVASLNAILRRHEALRARFVNSPAGPVQIIDDQAEFELEHIDLSGLMTVEREQEIVARLHAEKIRPFDLATDVLVRGSLLRLSHSEHVLFLTMHHIVSDGWSLGILFKELADYYAAYSHGRQAILPDMPIQYGDFAAWQRQWLAGEQLDNQRDYWSGQLKELPVLELPADRVRPAMQTYDGANELLILDEQLSEQLEQFSKSNGVTLFMTLLTGFMLMLHRYSGQDDIVVGTPIANRNRSELEGLIAFFVNMLVMRVDCSGNPSSRALLAKVSEMALDAYEHQDIPFEKLVEVLQVERDSSRNPLFQVLFAVQEASLEALSLEGLRLQPVIAETRVTRFDLECHVTHKAGKLQIGFVYNTNLFDATTIRRMQRHFANLLSAAVAEPERPIDELPMLDADERRLLEQWRQAPSDYPRDQTVQSLFEERVQASPDAIAAEYEGETLSYAELNARANQVGHYLQARGVGPEVVVGICIERSLEMLVALLGILKAGGAYLPLDPEYPQSRLDFMLADSAAPVLLTLSSFTPQFDGFTGRTICLDRDWAEISQESTDNPDSGATAESLIYVIYTSGSTGVPKGTLIEQRSAVRLVQNTNFVELGADEVFLQFAPISFDASTFELWGSLLNGARLVIFPAGRSALEELGEVIEARGVTTLWLTSALFSQMVEHHLERLRGVRQLLAGGEALSLPHVRKMIDNLGENRLINGYGPTENTTFTCCHVMTQDSELGQSVPIGRPISNTTVCILDKRMNPVPVGVAGELYIGGDGLARGYLNQPELTVEKFVADPFSEDQGERLYRTGDQVRYRDDGSIEFLGRIDQQVKVRGYRIELGEIETALAQQEAVSEAVAIVRADEAGDKRIIAYVVPTPAWRAQHPEASAADESGDESGDELIPELRQQLREQLPSYMLPSLFVVLDELPLNANGKVDRKALPDPDASRAGLEVGYVAPRNELESRLAQIWAEVLQLEQVGIHDNFFDLGGHSLMATQVVSRVRAQMNIELPLADMFSYPTLAELSPLVDSMLDQSDNDESGLIVPVDRTGDLPLSFAQKRLWFLDRLQPGNPAYIIPLVLRLQGELQINALLASLNTIVARHEALRTRFVDNRSGPLQVIDNEVRIQFTQTDLSSLNAEDLEQEVLSCIRAEKIRPFDLAADSLIRASLLRLSDSEHVLLLTMHHIISDGWSLGVLFRELGDCYSAFSQDRQPALDELPIQYADFAAWQRQWLSGEQLKKQQDYWHNQLSDLQVLDLPTDRTRPAIQTYEGAHESLSLNPALSAQLERLSKNAEVTLFMTLLAAYITVLHRYSGQDDVVVGTPIANRNRSELEGLIAIFVNMLVMRVDCSGKPDFAELVRRVSEVAVGAYEHQDIPFEKLVDLIQVERDPSRNPLFQVLFALQNVPMEPLQLQGITLEPINDEFRTIRFDLECNVWNTAAGLQIRFDYNTSLFDASTIKQMLQHYANLLAAAVAEPDRPIDLLPMQNRDEQALMLHQWNDTDQDYPLGLSLSQLVEAQVERSPDAIALEFDEQTLSYRQLNERVNVLARELQEMGVGPDRLVGVFMRRSLEMVIALHAIVRAGGAYVPLDPEYPSDRIAYMVGEIQPVVVLTQEHLLTELPDTRAPTICVDHRQLQASANPARVPAEGATADDLAYVIYTSGSTGRPKGVMNCHRGIVNRLLWMQQAYSLEQSDRVLQKTPFSFDVSVWEFFWPLITGARLVVAKPEGHKDPRYLSRLIRDKKISTLHFVPSMLKVFLDNTDADDFKQVKRVFCSGEALPYELQQQFFKAHKAELHNLYGPTEAAVDVSYWACREDDDKRIVPIGRPVANTQLYILDRNQQPVPIGVSGELHIGGVQVARGYLGQPELTAEKFIPDRFSDQASARLYKTGDLARYLNDGSIEYVGRIDSQIKLRGLRIELGEIETALVRHELVQDAVVIVHVDESGDKRLVAYLVANKDGEIVSHMRSYLKSQLPEYMVPSVYMLVDNIALSANGKLDRKNLPPPEAARQVLTRLVAPSGPLENEVAEIWKQVLELEEVGVEDNFFDLGGDSFLAIQLHNALEENFSLEIPITDLFRFTTIQSFAQHYVNRHPDSLEKQGNLQSRISKQRAAMRKNRKILDKIG